MNDDKSVNQISSNKRIAKNTMFLFFRMLVVMSINLYVSRVVVATLGVNDFGVYSVVGNIVIMLGVLSVSMSTSTQRFLSYSMGKNDKDDLSVTFNSTIAIHILLAVIIFVFAEIIGVWYISNYLDVDSTRLGAAQFVFQFSLMTMLVKIVTVPYTASIIANEKMSVYAYISILEAGLQLTAVFLLQSLMFDKLELYAVLMFGVTFLVQSSYHIYCRIYFRECKLKRNWNKGKMKAIFWYSTWSMFGATSSMAADSGVNLLLNGFFGVVVNAARAIAFQVSAAVSSLSSNFQVAMNPRIVKLYATNERAEMIKLINNGAKYSFFLLLTFSLPILFNTEYILHIWQKIVPPYSTFFCQLVLVNALIAVLSGTLLTAATATGKIKRYQIVVGGLNLLNLPISYLILKLGGDPYSTMFVMIALSSICLFARLILLRRMIGLSIREYATSVLWKVLTVTALASVMTYFIRVPNENIIYLFVNVAIGVLAALIAIWLLGTGRSEHEMVKQYVGNRILKFKGGYNC